MPRAQSPRRRHAASAENVRTPDIPRKSADARAGGASPHHEHGALIEGEQAECAADVQSRPLPALERSLLPPREQRDHAPDDAGECNSLRLVVALTATEVAEVAAAAAATEAAGAAATAAEEAAAARAVAGAAEEAGVFVPPQAGPATPELARRRSRP